MSVLLWFPLVNLWAAFHFSRGQTCTNGFLSMEPDRTDERLSGSTIVILSKRGPNLCVDECIRRPKCHSINYNLELLECELSEAPIVPVFLPSVGFDYIEIAPHRQTFRDPCPNSGCVEGEVCLTLYNGDTTCFPDYADPNMQRVSQTTANAETMTETVDSTETLTTNMATTTDTERQTTTSDDRTSMTTTTDTSA